MSGNAMSVDAISGVDQRLADYAAHLAAKHEAATPSGFDPPDLPARLFPHQRAVTDFLIRAGCGGAFLDTGLGKSGVELCWGRAVANHTGRPVLMLAPLAVGPQHLAEAAAFGLDQVRQVRDQAEVGPGVNIANYELLHRFQAGAFGGVVLDESSIIKSFTGATTRALMAFGSDVPYRLAGTATPAPNDHMELGQHAQFLGVMRSNEMLTRFFIADQSTMGRYRLKRAARSRFWSWMASWSRMLSSPADLGFPADGFTLPALNLHRHDVSLPPIGDAVAGDQHLLFAPSAVSATAIHAEKRRAASACAGALAEIVRADAGEIWCLWCDTDYEEEALTAALPQAVAVRGSMTLAEKERRLTAFGRGEIGVLVTKPRIAGFGLNWQHCARVGFVGLTYSYEQFYQALRRFWRFGQARPVDAHVMTTAGQAGQWQAVMRKSADHDVMKREMAAAMARAVEARPVKVAAPLGRIVLPPWLTAHQMEAA